MSIGQVSVLRPSAKVSTVVVGNPAVADVVVEGDSAVLVMARTAGQTDVVMLDQDRQVLQTTKVAVTGEGTGPDYVTVRRMGEGGVADEQLMCAPGGACAKVDKK